MGKLTGAECESYYVEEGVRWLYCATDGSGADPTIPLLRTAGYGVSYGTGHPCNVGAKVCGPSQTAQRGEVMALLMAITQLWTAAHIVLDSRYVNDCANLLLDGGCVSVEWLHQDAWQQ
eukprot:617291-Alexandrium_andersonii.AAC.1